MTVPRIYFPGGTEEGGLYKLGQENLRYVKTVLRMAEDERLLLFDGAGWEYEAVIKHFGADGITVEVLKKEKLPDKAVKICLFQALPKANKMDFIVRKAVELGVDRIVPFQSARSVPRLTADKARFKVSRWQKIAVEAARQCGRADVPEIGEIIPFAEVVSRPGKAALKIIFWEEETLKGVKQVLRDEKFAGLTDISIMIGPEGGFSEDEVGSAVGKGFISVSLGRNILKVETAALAILSIIQYEKGIFGGLQREEVTEFLAAHDGIFY